MNAEEQTPTRLAKITWMHPETGEVQSHILLEGATATIGRSSSNDIYIPDKHVSRQHAVIIYRDGVFMINDLGSVNGTFVNEKRIDDAFPLFSGDQIRLFVPTMAFSAADDEDVIHAKQTGMLISAALQGKGQLIITTGAQEGQVVPLLLNTVTIGRAVKNATWEIGLQDPSVSRPHAVMERRGDQWVLMDLGSSNGTQVNAERVYEGEETMLQDGDIVSFGATMVLYRSM
jgi:pSer/pThr/pTyr-binding forkhead associated (FHA) protein